MAFQRPATGIAVKDGSADMLFDVYSLLLLFVTIVLFSKRCMSATPPVYPYLIIACTCFVANWLGKAGGEIGAVGLLVAASFSYLGCLLRPEWRTMSGAEVATETARA